MTGELYEVVAQGARYWFLFLMAVIVWRSWRWFAKDRRQRKKRTRLLPDAGLIGEMVILRGNDDIDPGAVIPVPHEGTLGTNRTNDLYLPIAGIGKRHLWFRYENRKGLRIQVYHGRRADVDDIAVEKRKPAYMAHGSRLLVGEAELRLRMFAGFEPLSHESRHADPLSERAAAEGEGVGTKEEAGQDSAYPPQSGGALQQSASQDGPDAAQADPRTVPDHGGDMDEGETEGMLGGKHFSPFEPIGDEVFSSAWEIVFRADEVFYLPVEKNEGDEAEEEPWPYAPYPQSGAIFQSLGYTYPEYVEPRNEDEDLTDAAAAPKSLYVGNDEAERAKRLVWDRYFGGGHKR